MGLFWENKAVALAVKSAHLVLQLGLIAFAGYYYFQIQTPNVSDPAAKSDPRHAEKFFMMQIGLRVTFALITYITGLAKVREVSRLESRFPNVHIRIKEGIKNLLLQF